MPKFVFRLQVPLRLARAQRDGLRKEMALAMHARDAAESALADGMERVARIATELTARAQSGITGSELMGLTQAKEAARERLPGLRRRAAEAVELEEDVRGRLAHATREVTVLEKLRREAFIEWLRALQRKEQVMIDDVMMVRRARAMAGVAAGAGR